MYSLFIDTHDKKVVIVLFKDGKYLDKFEDISMNKHSVITMPAIRILLDKNNLLVNQISEILVVNGPGSFTGERIAVTIGKTMAYLLNLPIKTIDALSLIAVNLTGDKKFVSVPDRNGAFVGVFDSNNKLIDDIRYVGNEEYKLLTSENTYCSEIDIEYDLVYAYLEDKEALNPHEVKPLYIKGISALNGK